MKIDFTVPYTAHIDIEEAFGEYETYYRCGYEVDEAVYNAIEDSIHYPRDVELPQEVIETAATALRKRIGGIQMEMEGVR